MSQIIPIFVPTYISDQNYNPARVQPRLLYYNGQVDCQRYYMVDGSGVSKEINQFPYFDNYSVVSGSQFPTTSSKSLLFFNEQAVYGSTPTGSLFSEYWSNYVNLLYNPRTRLVNASAIIPLADYFKMELNDIVDFRGNYYHLRAINDYSLTDGTCKIQLLGPLLEGALDLNKPSDCEFTYTVEEVQCNYAYTSSVVTTTTLPPIPGINILSGGTSGSYVSGSQIFRYNSIATSGSFTQLNVINDFGLGARLMLIGGGGDGGPVSDTPVGNDKGSSGGGAGQITYYDNYVLETGLYDVFIGTNNQNSYIRASGSLIPFVSASSGATGSAITGGSCVKGVKNGWLPGKGKVNGAGGILLCGVGGSSNCSEQIITGSNGIVGLGFNGATPNNCSLTRIAGGGAGAGGAGGTASPLYPAASSTVASGVGLTYNLTSASIQYSIGGRAKINGQFAEGAQQTILPLTSGSGGDGEGKGKGGLLVLAYPLGTEQLTECNTYTFSGGAGGGLATYIPCGTTTPITIDIPFNQSVTVCIVKTDDYPRVTGTVTMSSIGLCNEYIAPTPLTPCGPTASLAQTFVYNYTVVGTQCYPTPESCQRLLPGDAYLSYYDIDGVYNEVNVGGPFGGGGSVCAREFPAPGIWGPSAGTITPTGALCQSKCIPIPPTTTTTTYSPQNCRTGVTLFTFSTTTILWQNCDGTSGNIRARNTFILPGCIRPETIVAGGGGEFTIIDNGTEC